MSFSSLRHRNRPLLGLAALVLLWPLAAFAEPDAIAVNVDQAKLVKAAQPGCDHRGRKTR